MTKRIKKGNRRPAGSAHSSADITRKAQFRNRLEPIRPAAAHHKGTVRLLRGRRASELESVAYVTSRAR